MSVSSERNLLSTPSESSPTGSVACQTDSGEQTIDVWGSVGHAERAIIDRARSPEITVIKPPEGWLPINLGAIWCHRELLYFLAWRDLRVRYKQTALGAAWAVLQPLATMLVFSIFFGRLVRVPTDNGIPYPIFVYSALVGWTLFAYILSHSSNSLVENAGLVTKVYFPRIVMPLSCVVTGAVDFSIAFAVLIGMMLFYRIDVTIALVALPVFVLLTIIAALGAGLWLSALNVQYRDVRHIVPFLIQLWFYATPVAYPSSLLPHFWRTVFGLNPMAGVVEGFRWALLGKADPPGAILIVSVIVSLLLLVSGLFYFQQAERSFADVA